MHKTMAWLTAAALAALATAAAAQTPQPFYRGKDLRLLISHPPGGGYDAYARLYARHLARHIPGAPTIVPQNMPGAAGIVMANFLASQAPRDGLTIGLGPGSIATAALFSARGARYDARKFVWIGSMNSEVGVSVAWHTAPVKKAQDLFTTELIVAGAANTDQSVLFPNALNKLLGTKFRIIAGYGGSSETALALERGEAQGIGGWNYSSIQTNRPQWLRDATINILVQLSLARHPDLPNVPTVLEIARNDEERAVLKLVFAQSQMGRALLAPPEIPEEAARIQREAFASMMKAPDFLAEAGRSLMEINQPMPAAEMTKLIEELHGADPGVVKRAAELVGN
jgi:tripartite-type tricarboxylate transporter receptor subunit TctC